MRALVRILFTMLPVTAGEMGVLSEEYVQFGKGPVQFVMTREERTRWKGITNDAEARAFIDLFWVRRDPAFHTFFDQAVEYADRTLVGRTRGSMTDMGRVLVIMGPPSRQRKYLMPMAVAPSWTPYMPDRVTPWLSREVIVSRDSGPTLCWVYDAGETAVAPLSPAVEICFERRDRGESWLLKEDGSWPESFFERINVSRLTRADLHGAPAPRH